MVEKSDKFDECMLNRQNFPTKILHLKNFGIAYFTVIIYQLEFVRVCHVMSGHGIRSTSVRFDAPEDKDPPEGKNLPNLSDLCLSKVIPLSS